MGEILRQRHPERSEGSQFTHQLLILRFFAVSAAQDDVSVAAVANVILSEAKDLNHDSCVLRSFAVFAAQDDVSVAEVASVILSAAKDLNLRINYAS